MSDTIKINNDTWLLRSEIRYLTPLTPEDQAKAGERYNIDGSVFQTRLVMADKSLRLIRETVQDLQAQQGLALIEVSAGKWVPAANIRAAKAYTPKDAKKAAENGLRLSQAFKSKVETSAGQVLGTEDPQALMQRVAVTQARSGSSSGKVEADRPASEPTAG